MKAFKNISFLFLLTLFMGCGDAENKNSVENGTITNPEVDQLQVTMAQFTGSNMQLGTLTEQAFPVVVQTTGMIDVPPQNRAVVGTFTGGYIRNTPLLIGDKIKKGQVLVTLENPEFVELQQHYLEQKEQLSYLKSEYDRQKTLVKEKISSEKNFLRSESEYKRTLALFNGSKKKLQMLNIDLKKVEDGDFTSTITLFAPIHGSITKLNVTKGAYVSPADEIMEIVNMDHIHLELSVFEKDILKIKENQKIVFTIPEAVEATFEAEVHLVGTSIDQNTRTIKVHGHIEEEKSNDFAVGMFVNAQIITDSQQALALPNDAIISLEGIHYVLLNTAKNKDNYSFVSKKVQIGSSFNGFTLITNADDFKTTDMFLTKGGFNILGEESGHDQ